MSLSDYTIPVSSGSYKPNIPEIEEGIRAYLHTLKDPRAVTAALQLVGNPAEDYRMLRQLSLNHLEEAVLNRFPGEAKLADEIVRLSYSRYSNGSYRPELSNHATEGEKPHEETHIVHTKDGIVWAVCLSSMYVQGRTAGEINELFEFDDPAFMEQMKMHQEVGRWASHPLFDVWKATPSCRPLAKKLQVEVMGMALRGVIKTGARYGLTSLAIYSNKVATFVADNQIARITPVKVRRKNSELRHFLEQHFASYWRDANPGVYRVELFD